MHSESREDSNRRKQVDTRRPKRRFDVSRYKGFSPGRNIGLRLLDSRYSAGV
jgi:hypothetical protein